MGDASGTQVYSIDHEASEVASDFGGDNREVCHTESLASQDGAVCNACNVTLGKRHLKPRHRCRVCNMFVCGPCSTSTIQLDGWKKPQRVCKICVSDFQKFPMLRSRLLLIAKDMLSTNSSSASQVKPTVSTTLSTAAPRTLDIAVTSCEASL